MALDPYAPCPCGSGKKLKFCCSDLATEIESIHKMIAGDQPHAALQHVARLLAKQPQRASLLDIKVSLELSLHEFDAAAETVQNLLAAHPQSPTAHAQRALLLSATQQAPQAVDALQDALEQLDDAVPLRVLEAMGTVGHALLLAGDLVAARAHLLLYAGIAPADDNRALELLMRMNWQGGLPLLLKDYLVLAACPPQVNWQTQFAEAVQWALRGLWRRAHAQFSTLRQEVGTAPAVVYNLALMQGWLGRREDFAALLHEYAGLDVPLQDAAEAEALAQLVDPRLQDPQCETVKLVYAVADADQLGGRLAREARVQEYPLETPLDAEEAASRPRSTHILMDRAPPISGVGLAREAIPHVVAFLSLYGKRTDRPAQLEVTTDRDEQFPQVLALLAEVMEADLEEPLQEEVVGHKSVSEAALSWRWRLPDDTPPQQRRKLLAQERREAILDRWTQAPRAALQGKSPQAAAGDPALRVALLASAVIIEQAAVDPAEQELFVALRQRLQLPRQEAIDPSGLNLEHVPLVRVPQLDLAQLSAEDMAKLLERTIVLGANYASLLVAQQLVERDDLPADFDLTSAYRQLVRVEPDYDQAQQRLAQARSWSTQREQSLAEWALLELELSIQRRDAEAVKGMLNEIRTKHLHEPGVSEATFRILNAAGLTPPLPAADRPPAGASAESAAVWTPGEERPPAGPAEKDTKSAIWTP